MIKYQVRTGPEMKSVKMQSCLGRLAGVIQGCDWGIRVSWKENCDGFSSENNNGSFGRMFCIIPQAGVLPGHRDQVPECNASLVELVAGWACSLLQNFTLDSATCVTLFPHSPLSISICLLSLICHLHWECPGAGIPSLFRACAASCTTSPVVTRPNNNC